MEQIILPGNHLNVLVLLYSEGIRQDREIVLLSKKFTKEKLFRDFLTLSSSQRPVKELLNLLKDCKIGTFKVIFQHQKSTESFWVFFVKNI